jgi:hypothetical protein
MSPNQVADKIRELNIKPSELATEELIKKYLNA